MNRKPEKRGHPLQGSDREGYLEHKAKKQAVRRVVTNAIRTGRLIRQPCERCGRLRNEDGSAVDGHHDDYEKPLCVRWLCETHHVEWHRQHGKDYYRSKINRLGGRQLKAARALVGWEQTDLAAKAGVAISTIRRMESFQGDIGARTSTLALVKKSLEKAGVEFLNDDRPGVRLKK
jgi:hypothetical protein